MNKRSHSQAGTDPGRISPGSGRSFHFCARGRARLAGASREEGGICLEMHYEMQILYNTRRLAEILDDVCAILLFNKAHPFGSLHEYFE